jgi:hypothetical protein
MRREVKVVVDMRRLVSGSVVNTWWFTLCL